MNMGFWSLFKKEKTDLAFTTSESKELPEIKKEDFIDETEPSKDSNIITISYGTQKPIDLIYSYLKEDYETKGYEDAICNPDMSYKEMNKRIIHSNLEIQFKQVILKYTDDLRQIDFHIKSRSQAGLIDIVKQLETEKTTLEQHMVELKKMEEDFQNDAPYMLGMLFSYERGFMRGLAALSLETLKNKNSL